MMRTLTLTAVMIAFRACAPPENPALKHPEPISLVGEDGGGLAKHPLKHLEPISLVSEDGGGLAKHLFKHPEPISLVSEDGGAHVKARLKHPGTVTFVGEDGEHVEAASRLPEAMIFEKNAKGELVPVVRIVSYANADFREIHQYAADGTLLKTTMLRRTK
jgi:hypothetical protein